MKPLHLLFALLGLSGCMVDFYGGNPRLQVLDGSRRWKLESVGLGDTAEPVWTRGFDPPVAYGGLTEVMDLPVAGDLNLFLRLRDTLDKDTTILHPLSEGAGDFRKIEMADDSAGILILR